MARVSGRAWLCAVVLLGGGCHLIDRLSPETDAHHSPLDAVDPLTSSGQDTAARGGSFFDYPYGLRSAIRNIGTATTKYKNIGFRCVRTLNP
jgi:formylglycine-generating enzyme required for sulfatase activity